MHQEISEHPAMKSPAGPVRRKRLITMTDRMLQYPQGHKMFDRRQPEPTPVPVATRFAEENVLALPVLEQPTPTPTLDAILMLKEMLAEGDHLTSKMWSAFTMVVQRDILVFLDIPTTVTQFGRYEERLSNPADIHFGISAMPAVWQRKYYKIYFRAGTNNALNYEAREPYPHPTVVKTGSIPYKSLIDAYMSYQ